VNLVPDNRRRAPGQGLREPLFEHLPVRAARYRQQRQFHFHLPARACLFPALKADRKPSPRLESQGRNQA